MSHLDDYVRKINLHSFGYIHKPIEYLNVIIQGIQSFFLNLHSNVKKKKTEVRQYMQSGLFLTYRYIHTRQGGIRDNDYFYICSICTRIY